MKKLLTIICALCLVMAFSMPAAALDDIEDNNASANLMSPGADTNQAGDNICQDNDGIESYVTVDDVASNNNNDTIDDDSTVGSYNKALSDNKLDDNSDDDVFDTDTTIKDNETNVASKNTLNDKSDDDVFDTDTTVKDNETNVASKNTLDDNSDDDVVDMDNNSNFANDKRAMTTCSIQIPLSKTMKLMWQARTPSTTIAMTTL